MKVNVKLLLFWLAVTFAMAAMAQQEPQIPVDNQVRIGHLDNGLTYYIRHHAEPQGQANFYIAQKVGSILEEENQRGLAHFLEHMCFNGTQHFPGNGVITYCERIGVKFGYNLNAYTSIDETVYNIDNVPVATVPSSIDSCLWILHDWADGLLLTDEDIDHERGVIHEEWRTRATAQIRLLEQILPNIYPVGTEHARPDGTNRYGHRLPIGLMEVVDYFPYQVLRDYYEQWYRPDLQGIVVVGDIDVDVIEAKIKDIFGTIAKPVDPKERYYVPIPDNEEPIIFLGTDKEQTNALSFVCFKHDPYPIELRSGINYYVYRYAMNAAVYMLNARLSELSQSADAPFIGAGVEDGEFFIAKTKHAFMGTVASSEEGLTRAVTTLYREMLRAVRNGFTASEYERAKAELLADAEDAYNARDKKKSSEFCRDYVRNFVDNEPIPGAENDLMMMQQIAPMVTAEMIGQVLAQTVGQNNLVLFAMLPEKEGLTYPSNDEMKAALAAVASEQIEPYQEALSDEPLLPAEPKAGKVKKSKADQLGYTKYQLSNGVNVYFRPTDFNANEVLMLAFSKGGMIQYSESDAADLKILNDAIDAGGLGAFSKTDLQKVLAGRKVSVKPHVGLYDEYINSSSTPKDLETMFQLNYLYFTALREDDEAFASLRERTRAVVANREQDPSSALQDTVMTAFFNHSKRVEPIHSQDIDQMNYKHIMQIARERFSNAADFTFIITGAVDEATLLPLLEKYIASLPATKKRETIDISLVDYRKGAQHHQFEREMQVPMATNVFFDHADIPYTLKNKLSFDLALNALSVVLLEEIREKEGGTYGIGAYGELTGNPAPRQKAYMQIAYQTNPERYEYLNQRVRDIIAQMTGEGLTEENLQKGKEFTLKNHNEALRENDYWQSAMENLLCTGVDITRDYEQVLGSITVEDARAILKALLDANNHTEVIMIGK